MQRLPSSAKELMVDIGVCHYMLIFEDIQGSLTMFDFGPIGGDVHVGGPDLQSPTKQPKSKTVAGEIRTTEVRSCHPLLLRNICHSVKLYPRCCSAANSQATADNRNSLT